MKTKEEKAKHDEMMERFRLYGEIFLLCLELVKGDSDNLLDFRLEEWEFEECDIDYQFMIKTDDDVEMAFRSIEFIDGMLWIGRGGNESVCFFDVMSESLKDVLKVLTEYKEV